MSEKVYTCPTGSSSQFILGVLVGGAIGAVVGLLAAPTSGRETRGRLKVRTKDYSAQHVDPVIEEIEQKLVRAFKKLERSSAPVKDELLAGSLMFVQDLEKKLEKGVSSISRHETDETEEES